MQRIEPNLLTGGRVLALSWRAYRFRLQPGFQHFRKPIFGMPGCNPRFLFDLLLRPRTLPPDLFGHEPVPRSPTYDEKEMLIWNLNVSQK